MGFVQIIKQWFRRTYIEDSSVWQYVRTVNVEDEVVEEFEDSVIKETYTMKVYRNVKTGEEAKLRKRRRKDSNYIRMIVWDDGQTKVVQRGDGGYY